MSTGGQTKLWYFENFNFLKSLSKSEKMDLSNCSVISYQKPDHTRPTETQRVSEKMLKEEGNCQ